MADNSRKAKLSAEVDSSGAKKGFQEIKDGARDMAQGVQQAAQQAGQGVQSIGDKAAPAAQKLDAATKSLIGSIQRTTAAMEAGGKVSARYYELLAGQRGANLDALRPYLQQLDAVNAKQQQANQALNAGTQQLNAYGMSAKQTAFALRQVPAQVTDIVTGLASGQRPLTVLIQQGGQLKDVFGGIGPAARALGGYVLSLVNPATIAAVALGGLAAAAYSGSKEFSEFQKQAILTGNALAGSIDRYAQLRDNLAGIAGTKGAASETLTAIASSAQLAGRNVQLIGEAAALMQKAVGVPLDKTVAQFEKLADSPAKAAAELNKQTNFLTASVYAQIKALEEQGKQFEAGELAIKAFAETSKQRAQQIADDAGLIERAWRGVTGAIKGAWDALKDTGRPLTVGEQLANVNAQIAAARGQDKNRPFRLPGEASLGDLQAQQRDLQRRLELTTGYAVAQEQANAANAAGVKAVDALSSANDKYAPKALQAKKAIDEYRQSIENLRKSITLGTTNADDPRIKALLDPKTIARTEAGIRQQFNETTGDNGVAAQRAAQRIAADENARLQKQLDSLDFSTPTKLTEAEKKVIQVEEDLKGAMTGRERAMKQLELQEAKNAVSTERQHEALQKQVDVTKKAVETIQQQAEAAGKQADAIRQQADAQEAANATFGKSKTAIEEMTLAQMKLQAAEADSSDTFDPKYVASLNEKVKAQERYVAALQKAEAQQLNKSLTEGTRVSQEEATSLQLELSLVGQTQQVRERIVAQRKVELDLAKELAQIDQSGASDADKEELRAKARAKARIDSENAANKAVLNEWQRTSDSINQSLTDALLRGFESGKGFAQNFRDTLKNMFSTLVLRPIIQAVMGPVSGQMSSYTQALVGGGSGGGGAGGGLMNNFGLIGAGYQALTGASVGASSASLLYANGVGALGGDSIGALIGANGGWAGVSAGAAGAAGAGALGAGATTFGVVDTAAAAASLGGGAAAAGGAGAAGAAGAGALAAIPVAGWVALAAVALYSMFGGKKHGPKSQGYYNPYNSDKYYSGNDANVMSAAKNAAQTIQGQYDSIVQAYGGSSNGVQFGLGYMTDPKGDSPSQVHVGVGQNGVALANLTNTHVGRSEEELQAAITEQSNRAILLGLQHANIGGKIGEYLGSLGDVANLAADKVAQAIARIQKAAIERQGLEQKLYDLTHTDLEKAAAARKKERDAIDESNYALYDHVAALTDLTNTLASQREQLLQAYQSESAHLQDVITRSTEYAKQLREVRDGLLLSSDSVLSRSQRTALASSKFSGTLTGAIAGNEDALQTLGGSGQDLISAVRQSARTPVEVAAAIARVSAGLTTAAAASDSKASVAQQQLDAMTQQLTALGLLNTSVITVGKALADYLATQTAIQQENLNYTAQIAQQATGSAATPPTVEAPPASSAPRPLTFDEYVAKYDIPVAGYGAQITAHGSYNNYLSLYEQGGAPGYASGGLASGVAIVGEVGKEVVDFQSPGRVYTNEQTKGMFASNAELLPALQKVAAELAALRQDSRIGVAGTVGALEKLVTIEKKRENIGMPPVRETV